MTARRPVVFDGGILGRPPITGVGRAFVHALGGYAVAAERPAILALPPGADDPRIDGIDVIETAAVASGWARRAHLPRLLRRVDAALLHAPFAALPLRAPCPVIATVHDLPWRADVRLAEAGTGWRARAVTRLTLRGAAVVIVPSCATRDDLRAWHPAPRARIEVVPHGVPVPGAPATGARDGPFLVIADPRPRKNLERLARAHRSARAAHPDLPDLLRVGPGARWVTETDKHGLLRAARALVMVSLHEGFGLPVVEAFGHGTPVLCGDRKSLPEIAGGAALLVDPTDEAAIAAALWQIHSDLGLRAELARRGRIRASDFTPERTAAHWVAIHRSLAG